VAVVITRFRHYLRTHGVHGTALAVARRLLRLIYSRQRSIVLVKELDSIVESPREGELRFEDLMAAQLPALAELNRRRGQPDVDRRFARYVRKGFCGFVGFLGEQPVGYYWWVDRDAPELFPDLRKLGLGLELGEGDVYGSDFFLLEEHRGGGIAGEFLLGVETSLRDRGYRRLWGAVDPANRPARWTYSTRGYAPMWTVDRRRVVLFTRTRRERLAAARS
jgi:GNAT superfamily N-acetyltransferase